MIQGNDGQFYVGVVEDRADPLMLGRTKVRVAGLHTHDKAVLPTEDLPWAMLMQPAVGGTGASAIGPAEGMTVIVVFADYPQNQQPIVIGSIGGIPQPQPVSIDKFEDTPIFKDSITPAGRPIPTNVAQATGNQIGPITEGTQTPALNQLVAQGQQSTGSTPMGVLDNIFNTTSQSMSAVGGLLGSIGGVGSSYGLAKSEFQNSILGYGNKDAAVQRLVMSLTSSGPLGNAITAVINGKGDLKSIGQGLGLSVYNIQSTFNAIKNPSGTGLAGMMGVVANAQQLTGLIAGTAGDLKGTLGAIYGELSNVSLQGTVGGVIGSATTYAGQLLGSQAGIASSGLQSLQNISDLFGGGDLTSGAQKILKGVFDWPADVVNYITNGEYSSENATKSNQGNINVLKEKSQTAVTSDDFRNVPEGSTPPVKGAYGGPNFGGGSGEATLRIPTQDMSKYEGGSQRSLNLTPPADWKGNRAKAEQNIKILIDACMKYGLSTKEQQAALLGIVGGECEWSPVAESAQYSSPSRLCEIFKTTFKGDTALAEKYCNWVKGNKGTPAEFFNFVYDPANNGRQLGNTQPGDGGKYYGRGFIQLTGRDNYARYSRMTGHDLVKNPDLLVTDPKVSAEVAVLYLMDRVKGATPTAHPGYFYAAKKSVGNNSPDIAARKLAYYEHFYGLKTPESYGYTEKQAGNANPPYSWDGSMVGNEGGQNNNVGFQDPHNKYPLKRAIGQPDISKLARGEVNETIVQLKESKRTMGIPVAMDGPAWNQPNSPYGAKYPFNQVRETESGHVMEFDDTPNYERIHLYHRKGTFLEMDANGTMVTKIVGDGYVLYDRNGFISVEGEANVTVGGNINIYCRSDANIEVAGSAEMKVGGSFDIGVARDMNIAVEGNFSVWANGNFNLQAKNKGNILAKDSLYIAADKEVNIASLDNMFVDSIKDVNIRSGQKMHIQSTGEMDIKSASTISEQATGAINVKSAAGISQQASSDINIKAGGAINNQAGGVFNAKAGGNANINPGGTANIKAGGSVNIDGSNVAMQGGAAGSAGSASDAAAANNANGATKALIYGMIPPAPGAPLYPDLERLKTPELLGEEKFMYEVPEDGATGASKAYNQERTAQEGKANTYSGESASAGGGGGTIVPSPRQDQILQMSDFTADFRLSEHFTLGMLFDGGFNVRHRLINQNGLTKQQIVANLSALCENILEKYLTVLPGGISGYGKQWRITSGYRMASTPSNSPTSDHPLGRACDIQLTGRNKEEHYRLIQQLDKLVPYDQLLLEYAGNDSVWIHTGFRGDGKTTFGSGGANRRMAFTMKDHTKVKDGFVLLG